jgi:hypothetical protein
VSDIAGIESRRRDHRDSFLDAVKALAITRVVLWRAWAWW